MNINETDHRSLTQWNIPLLAAAQPHYHNLFNWPTANCIHATLTDCHRSEVVDERDEEVWGGDPRMGSGANPHPTKMLNTFHI